MKKLIALVSSSLGALTVSPQIAWAKGKAETLVVVAHTKGLSGLNLYWANLYNDNMFLFTILTGCILPIAGLVLGWIGDWLIRLTGIDVSKRELAEH